MKRALVKILGSLAFAGALAVAAPADASQGGWLFPQPHPTYPQYVNNVTDWNGAQFVTFNAGLEWWGSWLDRTNSSGSYDDYMELYCTDWGWTANDTNSAVTGNAGDITLGCDILNFHYGAAAFYFVDT